jgi:glutamate racemase
MLVNELPIGVFDSGIGGLTVVKAITELLPHENIVYFGDTARVPYGPKSPQVVREYASQATDVLLRHHVKMIVIACNTVSAVALDVVMKKARLPITGVIQPGAEAAARTTKNKRIGVIGTVGTIRSDAYTQAIHMIDPDIFVVGKACPLFVPLAEEGWTDHQATELIAKEYLFPLLQERIDALVLGCTHYPLLTNVINKATQQRLMLVDSASATARTVEKILQKENIVNPSSLRANISFYVSDIPYKFAEVGARFFGKPLGKVERIAGLA